MNALTTQVNNHMSACYGEHLDLMPPAVQTHIKAAYVFGYDAALRDILIQASKGSKEMTEHIVSFKKQIIDYQKMLSELPDTSESN